MPEVKKVEVIVRVTYADEKLVDFPVDPDESFLAPLKWAIQDGKEPDDVLAFLADQGVHSGQKDNPIGWKNRVDSKFTPPDTDTESPA